MNLKGNVLGVHHGPRQAVMLIAVVLTALCASTTACTYAKPQPRVISGRPFPAGAASSLPVGSSVDEVRRILGEPLSVSKEGQEVVWKYGVSTQHKEVIRLFGFIPVPAEERGGTTTATLRFQEDRLMDVSVDRR